MESALWFLILLSLGTVQRYLCSICDDRTFSGSPCNISQQFSSPNPSVLWRRNGKNLALASVQGSGPFCSLTPSIDNSTYNFFCLNSGLEYILQIQQPEDQNGVEFATTQQPQGVTIYLLETGGISISGRNITIHDEAANNFICNVSNTNYFPEFIMKINNENVLWDSLDNDTNGDYINLTVTYKISREILKIQEADNNLYLTGSFEVKYGSRFTNTTRLTIQYIPGPDCEKCECECKDRPNYSLECLILNAIILVAVIVLIVVYCKEANSIEKDKTEKSLKIIAIVTYILSLALLVVVIIQILYLTCVIEEGECDLPGYIASIVFVVLGIIIIICWCVIHLKYNSSSEEKPKSTEMSNRT